MVSTPLDQGHFVEALSLVYACTLILALGIRRQRVCPARTSLHLPASSFDPFGAEGCGVKMLRAENDRFMSRTLNYHIPGATKECYRHSKVQYALIVSVRDVEEMMP